MRRYTDDEYEVVNKPILQRLLFENIPLDLVLNLRDKFNGNKNDVDQKDTRFISAINHFLIEPMRVSVELEEECPTLHRPSTPEQVAILSLLDLLFLLLAGTKSHPHFHWH